MAKTDDWTNYYDVAYNPGWKIRGRQLMLWISHSSSGYFNMSPGRQYAVLNANSMREISDGKSWILTLGLFDRTEKEGVFKRHYLPGETKLQYFHRALSKVPTKFALVWQLDRLLADTGCAPHSLQQFAEELGRNLSWISRYLKEIVAEGIVKRYGGNDRNHKTYYCTPGNDYLTEELLERYGEHNEEDAYRDARKESYEVKAQAREVDKPEKRSIEKTVKETGNEGPVVIKHWKKGFTPTTPNKD